MTPLFSIDSTSLFVFWVSNHMTVPRFWFLKNHFLDHGIFTLTIDFTQNPMILASIHTLTHLSFELLLNLQKMAEFFYNGQILSFIQNNNQPFFSSKFPSWFIRLTKNILAGNKFPLISWHWLFKSRVKIYLFNLSLFF